MNRFISRSIVWFLAPAITVLLGLMKLPHLTEKIPKSLVIFFDIFTVIGTIFIYYFSIWAPHKKYEKAQKSKWDAMEKLAKALSEDYADYKFSINIMLVAWRPFYSIEPQKGNPEKKKFSWGGKVFIRARELAGNSVPLNLRITINQGVCGKALREGNETSKSNVKGVVFLSEVMTPHIEADNNFTTEQKNLTNDVVLVASCPLIINQKDGDASKKKKLGVLNVESKELISAQLLADAALQDKFYEKIANLGNIFNTLHV